MIHSIKPIRPHYWLYAFILVHIFLWTLAPVLVRHTLPLDAMEGTVWGHSLQWGYDKNPFLNAWLTALLLLIGGQSGWAIYLGSQISVGISFWAIWKLASRMLTKLPALIAVLLLEGIQYYNFHAIDFNDNTLELSLWALTMLYFYEALRDRNRAAWLLTGFFAGLSMMAKYYSVMLLIPMMLFLVSNQETRIEFKKPNLYLGLLVFLTVIAPHLIWLCSNQFITVNYAVNRVSTTPTLLNHISYASDFAWQQIEAFIPCVILLLILILKQKPALTRTPSLSNFDKRFLLYLGLGPMLLTVLLSALLGLKLRAGWGQPLLSLWTILLVSFIQLNITRRRFYAFITAIFSLLGVMIIGYCISLIHANSPSSANFPGKHIARTLTEEWHTRYGTPLRYVAGPRWLAGNIAFYSKDHPVVYIDLDNKISPWINEKELIKSGAIFIWNKDLTLAEEKQKRFNHLEVSYTMQFAWLRNKKMAPVEIQVAFLPPVGATGGRPDAPPILNSSHHSPAS